MERDRFLQLIADGKNGVQACHGILKDDGNAASAEGLHFFFSPFHDIIALEQNLTLIDPSVFGKDLHDGIGGNALA